MVGNRVCEVCGVNESRRGGFFASFPLDEIRCRTWVKVVGKEDLVHLPIEKLHKIRSICGDHFEKKDFNQKGNRLKKRSYPKLNLLAAPLNNEQMKDFPLRVARKSDTQPASNIRPEKHVGDHNYYKINTVELAPNKDDKGADDADDFQTTSPCPPDDTSQTLDSNDALQNKPFSWQNDSEVVPVVADENDTEVIDNSDNLSMYIDEDTAVTEPTKDNARGTNEGNHEGFQCNACNGDIVGYRYTCVQCADYDLCSACEASGVHPHHYVLRVPGPRPQNEVQAVLEGIRRDLNLSFKSSSELCCDDGQMSLKSETKEEPQEFDLSPNNNPFTKAFDDPLSVHNTPCDHLDDAPSTQSSPNENESRMTQNFNLESESCEALDDKITDEPTFMDNTNPLKRKMIVNKSELVKVYKTASLLHKKRIQSIEKRQPSAIETTLVEHGDEGNEEPELHNENLHKPHKKVYLPHSKSKKLEDIQNKSHVNKVKCTTDSKKEQNVINIPEIKTHLSTDTNLVDSVVLTQSSVVEKTRLDEQKHNYPLIEETEILSKNKKHIRLLTIKSSNLDDLLGSNTEDDSKITYYVPENINARPTASSFKSEVLNVQNETSLDKSNDRKCPSISKINLLKSFMCSEVSVRVQPLSDQQIISATGEYT